MARFSLEDSGSQDRRTTPSKSRQTTAVVRAFKASETVSEKENRIKTFSDTQKQPEFAAKNLTQPRPGKQTSGGTVGTSQSRVIGTGRQMQKHGSVRTSSAFELEASTGRMCTQGPGIAQGGGCRNCR